MLYLPSLACEVVFARLRGAAEMPVRLGWVGERGGPWHPPHIGHVLLRGCW